MARPREKGAGRGTGTGGGGAGIPLRASTLKKGAGGLSCLLRPRSRGGQNKNRSASAIQAQSRRFKAAASGNASPAFFRPMDGPLAIGVEVRLGLVIKRGEGLIQRTTQTPRRSLFNQTLLGPVLFLFVRLCLLLSTCM